MIIKLKYAILNENKTKNMNISYNTAESKIEEYLNILENNSKELSPLLNLKQIKAKWRGIKLKKWISKKHRKERIILEKVLINYIMECQRAFKYENSTKISPYWIKFSKKSSMSAWDVLKNFHKNMNKLSTNTKSLTSKKTGLSIKDFESMYFKWRIICKREDINVENRANVKMAKKFKKFLEGIIEIIGIEKLCLNM